MTDRLLTPQEVADYCQLSTKTVLRAIRSGRLRACRLGTRGGFRIRPDDVEAWIATSTVEGAPRRAAPDPVVTPPPKPIVGQLQLTSDMGRRDAAHPKRPANMRP